MRSTYLLLLTLLIPLLGLAQKNEPVKSHNTAKSKTDTAQEVFIFPDHIRLYKDAMNRKVEEKSKELTKYLNLLAKNKQGNSEATINAAMKLFNNDEGKMVSVKRKGTAEPVTMPVRKYLNELTKLHYDNVRISWHNAQYVSNFTKQPDGTYAAQVAFEQEFAGTKEGELIYTYYDVTQKRIEVIVKVWDAKNEKPVKKSYVDVFLGNIGVVEE